MAMFMDDAALRALAHPARRSMLQLLTSAESTVGELADAVRLSQPATSQHLATLRNADLVEVRVEGNRRVYRVNFAGLAALRATLDDMWGTDLQRLKFASEREHREVRGS